VATASDERALVELLKREADLRVSEQILAEMEKAETSVDSEWMSVVESLQWRIVNEHNTNEGCVAPVSVKDLRLAALRHPEIAFWVKYNRARKGLLRVGDAATDVPLIRTKDGCATTLLAGGRDSSKPLVVAAGSMS